MTLVEFLYPVRSSPQRVLVTAALYYYKHHGDKKVLRMTPAQVKTALARGGIKKARNMNTGRALAEAVPNVHRNGARGEWAITGTGEKFIRKLLALPDPEAAPQALHDVTTLQELADAQSDEAVQDYIEEAIKCLSVGALRAAVVFLWSGAIYTIRETVWSAATIKQIDAALKKHNQRAKFGKKGDFEYVNDALLIEAAIELDVVARSEKKRLIEALDLRNDCGHPVKYRLGPNKVSSFIEDVGGIVFP